MKLKKINAVLSLLAAVTLLIHIGYSIYAYLTYYYNPGLKYLTAVPFMIIACLHAVCGMSALFLQADGIRADLYPKLNRETVVQRISAALIYPLLILHIQTYDVLKETAASGQMFLFYFVLLAQPLFYIVVMLHTAVSFSRALITLGWLVSKEKQKKIDKMTYIICSLILVIALYAVIKTELAMFL